jgi:hypothetical protein
MTKEELKQHCEKQVKMCEEWAKGNDREPSGKIYEEHKLVLDLINELEQQPSDCKIFGHKENCFGGADCENCDYKMQALEQSNSDDVMAIHTQGLAEGIRCAMCTNSMKSDRGCDGGCVVDEDMYKKVMDTINNQMFYKGEHEKLERIEQVYGQWAETGDNADCWAFKEIGKTLEQE